MASEEEVSIVRYLNCVKWQQLKSVTVALAGVRTFSSVISLDIFILVYIFLFLFYYLLIQITICEFILNKEKPVTASNGEQHHSCLALWLQREHYLANRIFVFSLCSWLWSHQRHVYIWLCNNDCSVTTIATPHTGGSGVELQSIESSTVLLLRLALVSLLLVLRLDCFRLRLDFFSVRLVYFHAFILSHALYFNRLTVFAYSQ